LTPKSNRRREWALRLALAISLLFLAYQISRLSTDILSPEDDFAEYWAASRLLLSGGDPYSPEQMLALQQAVGRPRDYPVMMYNPPWTLTAVLWSGFLPYGTARALWLLFMMAALVFSGDLLWRHYGGATEQRWLGALLALTFIPALMSLNIGQIGPLILLGLAGFLHFGRRGQWGWAGACLALASVKPQLLYLLWAALALWSVAGRQWRAAAGGAVAIGAGLIIPLAISPNLTNGYVEMSLYYPPVGWAPPTWGSALRLWFGVEKSWLQWMPAIVGSLWLLFYWQRRRGDWRWDETLPPILLVVLATAVYGWAHDQIILIVVVMQTAVWGLRRWEDRQENRAGWRLTAVILLYLLTNGLILLVQVTETGGIIEVWTTLAWPSLYLLARGLNAPSPR
jgi:hypothetical protein